MHYKDTLYGPVTISEPVLLDLMACQAMQRLTRISQHGITALHGITPPFSRNHNSPTNTTQQHVPPCYVSANSAL